MAPIYLKLNKKNINEPNNILNNYTDYELIIFQKDYYNFYKITCNKKPILVAF